MDQTLVVDPPGVVGNDFACPDWHQPSVVTSPNHGSVNLSADGGFEYVPDTSYTGSDFFAYAFEDANGNLLLEGADVAGVNIFVTSVPPPPDPTVPGTTEPTTETTGATEPGTIAPGTTEPGVTAPGDTSEPDTTTPATAEPRPPSGETTAAPAASGADDRTSTDTTVAGHDGIRVATLDASLTGAAPAEVTVELATPDHPQASTVAEILQRTRPDVVVLSGVDNAQDGETIDLFRANYLEISQGGADPIDYPHVFTAPVNAGVPSGLDLDNDGSAGGPGDALAPGAFPGQAGMVVLSQFPIVADEVRTFQRLPWATVPGAQLPDDPSTPEPGDWHSPEELEVLPLSTTSHWDVPIDVDGRLVHVLASNPKLPVDGATDRDLARHADEVGFWADYLAGADTAWIVDDAGTAGGLAPDAEFLIVGTLNSDPLDGEAAGVVEQVLGLDRVQDPEPSSHGAFEAATTQGLPNTSHRGHPAHDTADLPDYPGSGNLRVDYVLPSDDVVVLDAGVFWPPTSDPLSRLVALTTTSSGHRLVWVDLAR